MKRYLLTNATLEECFHLVEKTKALLPDNESVSLIIETVNSRVLLSHVALECSERDALGEYLTVEERIIGRSLVEPHSQT